MCVKDASRRAAAQGCSQRAWEMGALGVGYRPSSSICSMSSSELDSALRSEFVAVDARPTISATASAPAKDERVERVDVNVSERWPSPLPPSRDLSPARTRKDNALLDPPDAIDVDRESTLDRTILTNPPTREANRRIAILPCAVVA